MSTPNLYTTHTLPKELQWAEEKWGLVVVDPCKDLAKNPWGFTLRKLQQSLSAKYFRVFTYLVNWAGHYISVLL